jgi:Flp pilus assembly protein TadD
MSLGVDKLSTSGGGFDGLKVSSQVTEHGDRLDMVLSYGVQNASVAGQTAKNLSLEMALKDVHAASFETISRVASDSCGLQNLTTDEDSRVRSAVRTLLASGLSMGIPKLAGTVGEGSLDGQLSIDLMATKGDAGGAVALAKLLKSSGKLTLSGNVLNANQKQMAVAMGVATETPKGLEAAYEYVDGIFKANGRVFDAGKVQTVLASADQEINRFLNTPRLAANKATAPADAPLAMPTVAPAEAPAAPAETAPVSAPSSAPISAPAAAPATAPTAPAAPVAAAAGNCDNVQACMAQSLRTAAREDLDTLRSVASRIEALPKPDLGNKAVARKLNTEALEALKREDHAAAVETLRRALQENPRDVEVASNLGFAQVRAGRAGDAVATLTQALVLDPRRTSTWTPLAEALALTGRKDDALAALWVGYQWSANRDKSRAFYAERAEKERATRPALADLYATVAEWTGGGRAPALAGLARN